jgi:hypothetical protein
MTLDVGKIVSEEHGNFVLNASGNVKLWLHATPTAISGVCKQEDTYHYPLCVCAGGETLKVGSPEVFTVSRDEVNELIKFLKSVLEKTRLPDENAGQADKSGCEHPAEEGCGEGWMEPIERLSKLSYIGYSYPPPISRRVFTHPFYEEPRRYSQFEALLEVVRMSNVSGGDVIECLGREDSPYFGVGNSVELVSVNALSQRWSWKTSEVVQFFEQLIRDGWVKFRLRDE